MRLLVLSQYFWPETFRITEVVQSLREVGCEVTVLTGQPNYPTGIVSDGYSAMSLCTDIDNGLEIHRVPLVPRGRGGSLQLVANYLSFVVSATVFGPWLLRGRRFDAILVYAPSPILQAIPAVWLAWLKGAKLVTWVQDLWPESLRATGYVRSQRVLSAVATVVRWIYRRNDLLLAQSEAFVDPIRQLAGGTRVVYHPNPGELAVPATPTDSLPALVLEPGFNVVFAGNLGTVQALDTVVAAAGMLRDLPDVRFVIVGSGSRGNWLADEVRRQGLGNVQLAGRFPPQSMPGILAQASVLLVTLARDPILAQTVPSKVQAYLAAARPIVAALDGEGARMVEDAGAGVACPAEDAPALASAVRRMREMPAGEQLRMALQGRAYYDRHFDPAVLAIRLRQILEDVVKRDNDVESAAR